MKTVEFKFDLEEKVTTVDGIEGIVGTLMHRDTLHKSGCNKYEIRLKAPIKNKLFLFADENELLAGHDLFKHERSQCPSY